MQGKVIIKAQEICNYRKAALKNQDQHFSNKYFTITY